MYNSSRNRIAFKIKTWSSGPYVEPLAPEMMKLHGSTKSKIIKDENAEKTPCLEITEVVLVHYKIVKNDYQQDLRVLHIFISNKSFSQLLEILPKKTIFKKAFHSKFSYLEVCFTDQIFRQIEIEDETKIALAIN